MIDPDKLKQRIEKARIAKQRSYDRMINKKKGDNYGYKLMDGSYNLKEGVVKISAANTLDHEMAKCKICWLLNSQRIKFFTEVIFKNHKGRADIFCPQTQVAYEVLHTESIAKFNEVKIKNYPEMIEVIPLKSKDILSKEFEMI